MATATLNVYVHVDVDKKKSPAASTSLKNSKNSLQVLKQEKVSLDH